MKKPCRLAVLLLSLITHYPSPSFASQDSIVIVDGSGAAVLTNSNSMVNLALKTVASDFAGPNAPTSPLQYQTWWDTTNNVVKKYDGTNWIPESLGPVVIKTGNYNFTIPDVNGIYQANSASAIAFNLLAANGVRNGSWLHFKNTGAGTLTMNGTINGATNPTLPQYGEAFIWSDGTSWRGTLTTPANVANSVVMRDVSGNFTAGTITASLTGNVTGNVTGNTSGSSGSCTGNSATATDAGQLDGQDGIYYRAASGGYTQAGTGGETLKTLRGRFTNSGSTCTVDVGSGFTVSYYSASACYVNYNTGFSSQPTLVCSKVNAGFCHAASNGTTQTLVSIYNTAGSPASGIVDFVVTGAP